MMYLAMKTMTQISDVWRNKCLWKNNIKILNLLHWKSRNTIILEIMRENEKEKLEGEDSSGEGVCKSILMAEERLRMASEENLMCKRAAEFEDSEA